MSIKFQYVYNPHWHTRGMKYKEEELTIISLPANYRLTFIIRGWNDHLSLRAFKVDLL